MRKLRQIGRRLQRTPDRQVSLTDPDARSMATSGRGTGIVGYNVQTAVDTKHHMIVAHEVTNVGHDRTQLASMARLARDAVGRKKLTVLADRGYFAGQEIVRCAQEGIRPLVPKPLAHDHGRTRYDPAQVLALRLPAVSNQAAMHARRLPTDHALGARTGVGCHAGSVGLYPRGIATAATDR